MNVRCNLEITGKKKNHNFIFHREQQVGGSTNQQLPLNVLRSGVITYFSINYYQHRTFYDFFDSEKIVDSFLNLFQRPFAPNKKVKFQGYIELINYQQAELIELEFESKRVWLTDVFAAKYLKTKMILEFNNRESASIKSFAVKKRDHIKVTTRFFSGKMLMSAKLSLMSFIYEVLETFCFPDENVQAIFKKYAIEKVEICHI